MLHALFHQRHIHTNVNRKRQTWTEPESVDAVVIIIIMIKTSEIDVTEKLTFDLFSLTWRMRLSAAQWLPETQRALWAQGEWRRNPQCIMGAPGSLSRVEHLWELMICSHLFPCKCDTMPYLESTCAGILQAVCSPRGWTGRAGSPERRRSPHLFVWRWFKHLRFSWGLGFWVHLLSSLFCWHTHNAPGFLD